MKTWVVGALAGGRRGQNVVRAALALLLLGALLWALPTRRPGEEGGHHAPHEAPALDPFEKAGISELKAGQRGPALSLLRLGGARASLRSFDDKLVVLNFWATWCTPCTFEMPTLEALWQGYRDRGLVVLAVSVDRGAPRALLDPYVKHLALTFPILLDPDMAAANAWRVTGLPTTFLVRPGGEVVGVAIGPREWNSEAMRALLEPMLPARGRPGAGVHGTGVASETSHARRIPEARAAGR
jgi:peroxiredoxin